jgi:hypothetical protein
MSRNIRVTRPRRNECVSFLTFESNELRAHGNNDHTVLPTREAKLSRASRFLFFSFREAGSSRRCRADEIAVVDRPINEPRCQSLVGMNEGLFYFGSDDSDVAEIGGGTRPRPPG